MNDKFTPSIEFSRSFIESLETNPYLPVFWIRADGLILNVNDAVCKYIGYSKDELTSMNVRDIDGANSSESLSELMSVISKQKVYRFETRHRKKDGTLIDVEVVANHYLINGDEFSFSYVFDISDRKARQHALEEMVAEKTTELREKISELEKSEQTARHNEELFINAFKTSQDAINLNDINEATYLSVNDGFLKIMGYTREEVVGRSALELNIWKDPEARRKLINDIKQYGYCHNFEADFVRKDGTVVHGLMSASIQEYNGRKVLLNVSKDISQIKELENELKELNSQLRKRVDDEVAVIRRQQEIIFEQKKLADMGMMINAIAHQWRQPLNVLGLRTQDIADSFRAGELTEEYLVDFEQQQMDTIDYLSATIDDFRTFFKPDVKETEFDVTSEIISLLKLIEIQMFAKGIKPCISFDCGQQNIDKKSLREFPNSCYNKTIVKGYSGEFKQVITNLVYNAIFSIEERYKQSNEKDGYIHIKIKSNPHKIMINIEDNGTGIPEHVRPHVFNPYYTTKEEGKGTGLGLYLAKLIIETHMNGTIALKDTDKGADFEIILPTVSKK